MVEGDAHVSADDGPVAPLRTVRVLADQADQPVVRTLELA
jgi:hypothetical protein